MPSSTLDRPRSRAHPSEWVVIVPGQPPDEQPAAAPAVAPFRTGRVATLPRPSVDLRGVLTTVLNSAAARLALMVGLACAAVMTLGLVTGRDPLLAVGLKAPQFVAYEGTSTEQVRFVLDDGMSQTAAVPGALLMDWREGQTQPSLRLAMGNPSAEPEVATLSVDGKQIKEIRYVAAWPGIDAEIRAMPGGWAANMIVAPGIDPATIEFEYVGATELTVDPLGRLRVRTENGTWIDGTPESWQIGPNGKEPVQSSYELRGGTRFGFTVGPYDPSRTLIVDPPSERVN